MTQLVENPPAMPETRVQSQGWEDPLEKRKATQLQCSGLENSMDCIVHGVAKSQTPLSNFHFHFHIKNGIKLKHCYACLLERFRIDINFLSRGKKQNAAIRVLLQINLIRSEKDEELKPLGIIYWTKYCLKSPECQTSWLIHRRKACSDLSLRTSITAQRSESPGLAEVVHPSDFQFISQKVN